MATDQINKNHDEDYEIDTLTNDRLIKGHSYDGIRELDNDLPPWWKWLFYLTIVFAIAYMIRLWVFQADDLVQNREYELAMQEARQSQPEKSTATFEVVLLDNPVSLAKGQETWVKICAACHLVDGGGIVGPNMTDEYWIHGNKIENLYDIITTGVIEKGMIPYKDQLSEEARLEVASYILVKLQGTTPATPKAPQGEKY